MKVKRNSGTFLKFIIQTCLTIIPNGRTSALYSLICHKHIEICLSILIPNIVKVNLAAVTVVHCVMLFNSFLYKTMYLVIELAESKAKSFNKRKRFGFVKFKQLKTKRQKFRGSIPTRRG